MANNNDKKFRLRVFRSNKNIFAQLMDERGIATLTSASSLSLASGGNIEAAKLVGADIAKKAIELKVNKIVFDRGRYQYKGRVKALAESARENGLNF